MCKYLYGGSSRRCPVVGGGSKPGKLWLPLMDHVWPRIFLAKNIFRFLPPPPTPLVKGHEAHAFFLNGAAGGQVGAVSIDTAVHIPPIPARQRVTQGV